MPLSPRSRRFAALFLALCAASTALAHAQPPTPAQTTVSPSPAQLEQILSSQSHVRTIAQVDLSPDGKRVAWLEASQIRVAPFDNLAQSQPVTGAAPGQSCNASDLVWSPDSTAVAFLSDCEDPGEQPDLFLSHLDGNPARRITNLHGYVDAPAFSPDSAFIAFLYVAGATRPPDALAAQTPPSGVIGEDHIEIQRVAIVPAGASQPVAPGFVTPPNLHVFEFDWSPDSKSLAYIAADPPGENNWWIAKLYTQPVAATAGAKPTAILSPSDVSGPLHGLQIAVPRWSPNGQSIAFIGGLMSDQGVIGGDVWVVPSAGGQPPAGGQAVDLTPNRPTSAQWIGWDDDQSLYVAELAGGDDRLIRLQIPATAGAAATFGETVFTIPGDVGSGEYDPSLSASADRSLFVFTASTFNTPPEIFAAGSRQPPSVHSADTARLFELSHFNDGVKPFWGDSVSLSWKSDNFHIQGWLLLPAHYDPAKKYPLLVEVHGGPASSVPSRWDGGAGGFSATAFSSLGYFVLMPNPRGSYGQGEAFTQANRKDFGYGDLRDILAGVDTVLGQIPGRSQSRRHRRLELRRIHDHVRRHSDPSLPCRGCWGGHFRLALLLRRKLHRPVDDSVLRRLRL